MKNLKLILIASLCSGVVACSGQLNTLDEVASQGATEQEINAPVPGESLPADDGVAPEGSQANYSFPQWRSAYGISETIYNRVRDYYNANYSRFTNHQYVVIIDMGLHSSAKRFTLINLANGSYERHNVAHGSGSDPDADGWLNSFSNVNGSKKTSVGYYKTLSTYVGSHGRSLRLDGLSSTNSNALSRAIVVHGASYVSDSASRAGRSWGCPALADNVAQGVIDKIKGGALLVIASSRAL
jgi:hypothetical protein